MTTKRSGSYARFQPPRGGGTSSDSPVGGPLVRRADAAYADVGALERFDIELLPGALLRHCGHDFRSYAFSSLRRRLTKRPVAEGLLSFSALQALVLHDGEAMDRPLRDMSVNVRRNAS